jgi:phosphatidylinositol alpha-mannosyltransferase
VARIGPAAWTGPAYRRWVRDGRFDVVHLHEPLAPGLPQAVLRSAVRGGPPVVATVHATLGSPVASAALRLAGPVLRRRLAAAAAVTAVSATAATTAGGVSAAEITVIGNGVRMGPPPDRTGRRGPGTVVLVGRLDEPRKGVDVLLAAWPDVLRRVPGARLVLVGPGWPRGASGGRLPPGVDAVGPVDEAGRAAALAGADVAVAPNRGGESFGLVVAEAMADGLPVVASDLPAFSALMGGTDGGCEGGVLVPAGEPGPLADALARLLTDTDERRARGADGLRLVARHSWPRVTARYLELYRAVLRA